MVDLARYRALVTPKKKRVTWKRDPEDFARIYGSRERATWVKSRPCVAMNLSPCSGPIDNAHTESGKGVGYKAGYKTIAPMCRGHHKQFDRYLAPFDTPAVRAVIQAFARVTERDWRSQGRSET